MTPDVLELEKNLIYYKNHSAKNQLGIIDKTITKEYLDLEVQINPALKDYSTQRKAELEMLLKDMNDHAQLLKTKEIEVDSRLKGFYEGFENDWEDRKKDMEDLDNHLKDHNASEVVRHIQHHWIDKLGHVKETLSEFMDHKEKEILECPDDICKEKAQKIIDWIKKTQYNILKIIAFFQDKIEEYKKKDNMEEAAPVNVEQTNNNNNQEEPDKNKNRLLLSSSNSNVKRINVGDDLTSIFGDDSIGEVFEFEEGSENITPPSI